jgi:hypothetical protein
VRRFHNYGVPSHDEIEQRHQTDLKRQYEEWFQMVKPYVAFTGTVKQALLISSEGQGAYQVWEPVTVEKISRNVTYFMERLSRDALGRSAVRRGEQLTYCAAIEGMEVPASHGGQRFHVHIGIGGFHSCKEYERGYSRIVDRWTNSMWGYSDFDLQCLSTQDDRDYWIRYLLKRFHRDKSERFIATYSPLSVTSRRSMFSENESPEH